MYHSIQVETRDITPVECEKLWIINTFPGQRKFRPDHAKELLQEMADRKLLRILLKTAQLPDGSTFLIDGQHSVRAVIELNQPYPANWEHYYCETEQDLWTLMSKIDNNKTRTLTDTLYTAKHLIPDSALRQIGNLAIYRVAIGALRTLRGAGLVFVNSPLSHEESVLLLVRESDLVVWASRFMRERWLRTTGVVCAMFATRRANRERAEEFWSKVKSGELLSAHSPEFKLREWLKTPAQRTGVNSRARISSEYITCICWWNAWISGKPRVTAKLASRDTYPTPLR